MPVSGAPDARARGGTATGSRSCIQLDPLGHPALALPEFVRRQISLANGETLPGCADCG
ncbi:hypothetical protein [Streptomyces sp. NBC_01618]|uniref:hypothetical protein n=1 Tax=Streptomyces sp. NBC_01618 TaxID=2975900 RepID=UPI00386B9D8F|nr:hypothetical protein OH735_33455 [Streptomyces sp. NBC_01618]